MESLHVIFVYIDNTYREEDDMNDYSLEGMEPSYIWEDDQLICYTTNKGQVQLDFNYETNNCIYGIGRNLDINHRLEVQIHDYYSLRVATNRMFGGYIDEFCNDKSLSRAYGKSLALLPVSTILETLEMDDDESYAGIAVKRGMMICLSRTNMNKADKAHFKAIAKSWRKRVISVPRTPITGIGGDRNEV